MQRKLVKQGAATMMISLPSKWIKANELSKGDEINLEEKGKELIINTKETLKQKKETNIKITNENQQDIKNILTHLYRKGFDKIILEGLTTNLLKKIRIITNCLLLGFEITERNSTKCILENISEPIEQKYNVMLKKVFLIIKETQNLIIKDFEKGRFANMHEIEETKNQQDKFILFCRRLLIKEKSNSLLDWELLTFLMHIQHTYYYLYKYVSKNKIKPDNEIISLLKNLRDYFVLFEDGYYNKNIKSIHKINNLKEHYQFGKCLSLIEKTKGKESVVHSYIRELFRLIQIGTSPVLSELLEEKDY